jgi:hypothetical protein
MTTHTRATQLLNAAIIVQAIVAVLVVMLVFALVVFMSLVPSRHAYGGVEVFSEGAAVMAPLAADGIVAIVSAVMTAAVVVWLYVRQLAH